MQRDHRQRARLEAVLRLQVILVMKATLHQVTNVI